MLLIRVCQWIKLQIQLITKDPVEVIRAGFRKSDKPSSIIPGMFKGQPFSCPLSLSEVQIVHLRIRVRHFVIWLRTLILIPMQPGSSLVGATGCNLRKGVALIQRGLQGILYYDHVVVL